MADHEASPEKVATLVRSLTAAPGEPAVCVALRIEERIQRRFMVGYQLLVFFLAAATAVLLIGFIWRIASEPDVAAGLQAAGAVVTGVAAGFLRTERRDARDAHQAAKQGLETNGCVSE